jgi:hypothetical protein
MYMLFTGMLGKSKGQILRVAAVLQVLFQMVSDTAEEAETDDSDMETSTSTSTSTCISDKAVLVAINFVELCCQQASYMAGRGDIREDIQNVKASMSLINKLICGVVY